MTEWNSLCPKTEVLHALGLIQTTAWKLGSMSYSKLKTCLLWNCIERETIHSILKTSEGRLRSEVWGLLPQSWGLRIFSLSYARDKTKRHLKNCLNSYITWIFGGYMLKISGGHFMSTSSTARKTIQAILMKLLR